jgi:hypothetical protein
MASRTKYSEDVAEHFFWLMQPFPENDTRGMGKMRVVVLQKSFSISFSEMVVFERT